MDTDFDTRLLKFGFTRKEYLRERAKHRLPEETQRRLIESLYRENSIMEPCLINE